MQSSTADLNLRFKSLFQPKTLFKSLLDARRIYGKNRKILFDHQNNSLSYEDIISRSFALASKIAQQTNKSAHLGILLANSLATVVCFFAMQACQRIPCLLNFSAGHHATLQACEAAQIKIIYTSKQFIEQAKLELLIKNLELNSIKIFYLEDLAQSLSPFAKLIAKSKSWITRFIYISASAQQEAVTLFTSGSENTPKGVALSHLNIQANRAQVLSVLDLKTEDDILLNVLPLFHSFGLIALLLAILSGIRTVIYPSPLHYHHIPQLIEQTQTTIFFATDTFLQGYAHYAQKQQLRSLKLVFAGAEKLKPSTRLLWKQKFGIEILEGYGTTETGPVLSLNTPQAHKVETVGRLLPSISYQLDNIEGIKGGRLKVSGPNVMLGYYQLSCPGRLEICSQPYDTGDIVEIDTEGFIEIRGRAKRFAKIAGEMISLQAVEQFISELWPDAQHAVLSKAHAKHGESLVLLTNQYEIARDKLIKKAQQQGFSELMCPKEIIVLKEIPLLATGKINYRELESFLL